ncbi:MAG: type I methionyl aminopeptidase [Saprospiraceae bacterium]|nr:type I methionyl aminopeptidase [Saprospiraceae bacterium]MDW8483807.1 type I methionyl aminopeptidase [Saprospiraceae bacterium]
MGFFSSIAQGKKVFYKTDEEIELMRMANLIVSKTLAHVATLLRPGISGKVLDREAETFIRDLGGRPAFKGYNGFPASLCISHNDIVVHGIPDDRPFEEDDIVSIDCGVEWQGYYGDAAFTFAFMGTPAPVMELLEVTYGALYQGIEQAVAGKRVGDIAFAIQHFCEREHPYAVVRELVGHGIGRSLHEEPEVPNYGKRGQGLLLQSGLTLAIEPMVNMGRREVYQHEDGWTIHTRDGKPSAHYEHSIAVRKERAEILSDHSLIHEAIKNNPYLKKISPKSKNFAAQKN